MSKFKVIQNQQVVDVSNSCLCWNQKYHRYYYCSINDAMLVQGVFSGKNYHDDWLRDPPDGDDSFDIASIVTIDDEEYDELYELLDDGENVPVPEPEPEPIPQPVPDEPDTEPDRPMTIAEMREKIQRLEESLDIIMGVIE